MMELRKGDLIEVRWLDILEDLTGNPETGDVAPRVSIGYFWCIRTGRHGSIVFVTTTTMDVEEMGQNGYCAYPIATVVNVKMIRKGRGNAYKASPVHRWGVGSWGVVKKELPAGVTSADSSATSSTVAPASTTSAKHVEPDGGGAA